MTAPGLLTLVRMAEPDTEDDRARILDAARSAFVDFGIRRASMGVIAHRAKISPATLHRRYAQKADLVLAVGLREVRTFLNEVDARVDHDTSAQDQLVALATAVFTGIRTHDLLARLMVTEPEIVLPYLTIDAEPVLGLAKDYLTEFITRLQAQGAVPKFPARPIAEVLARIVHSLALNPRTELPADAEAFEDFARLHLAGLLLIPASAE